MPAVMLGGNTGLGHPQGSGGPLYAQPFLRMGGCKQEMLLSLPPGTCSCAEKGALVKLELPGA